MMDAATRNSLWLQYGTDRNTALFLAVCDAFSDLDDARKCVKKREFAAFPELPDEVRTRLATAADDAFMDRYAGWMERRKVRFVPITSDKYPPLLREIPDPPAALFYRGKWEKSPLLPIAVVGTRSPTEYGKQITELLTGQLSEAGATVVTGLAAGVDSVAARTALKKATADCAVIGVLGCGIDVVYPSDNARLFDAVAERGLLVTEFLPKTEPLPFHFPIRNRIVSGLSLGVLVTEAGERSGTAITAACALEQGREVFAVPGRVTDLMSAGPNRMIARGEAKTVLSVSDILNEVSDMDETLPLSPHAKRIPLSELSELEKRIYFLLCEGEKNADELYAALGEPLTKINSSLTSLQFSGIMKQLPGRLYALDPIGATVVGEE